MIKLDVDIEHYQKCCLIIANEIKRICEKHNIKYSLDGGTLLGAVRHKGFIPWDDDMDFGMLKEDYIKFLKICESELDEKFSLLNWDTDPDFPFYYSKIVLNNTHIVESFSSEHTKYDGIFVDIFPYEKLPVDLNKRKQLKRKAWIYKRILWVKKGYGKCIRNEGTKQKLKYDISKITFSLVPYESVKRKYINLLKPYEKLDYGKCCIGEIDVPETFLNNYTLDNCFNYLTEYDFNGNKYTGFENYNYYLTAKYGDYMTLPPENKRINHGILKVDFGQY